MVKVHVIGIDCATEDKRIGLALGKFEGERLYVEQARTCSAVGSARQMIVDWIRGTSAQTLLAIDAPLGWPADLSRALNGHRAGSAITVESNQLFRRETDRFIKKLLGITPLDVGADRIARTAHAALRLMSNISLDLSAGPVQMAWSTTLTDSLSAIEVYPAATLVSHGLSARGYKQRGHTAERVKLIREIAAFALLPDDQSAMMQSADALDAVVCLVAARDFLLGRAVKPDNLDLAVVEGWIWVNRPSS